MNTLSPAPPKRTPLDILFGRPLANSEERAEQIGPAAGIPIFGLDALSSAAYGPEAALTLLIPLGLAGVKIIVPISAAILILLVIVYFSYRQTIEAYPHGGGSYTVASENLGTGAGLLAAAALMIDYVLTAAVGISAGVGALVSAIPSLQPHTLSLCLLILALLTLINMRGVRDTGVAFLAPTYIFLISLFTVIVVGLVRALLAGGHPHPVVPPATLPPAITTLAPWLVLKVFASGCTAMTGVEAVSNGVMAFREPAAKNARISLTIIIALLIMLLAGIAVLCRLYGVGATEPGTPSYQSVLSQLTAAVMGHGVFYYVTSAAVLAVLALSANTAFADFPRLTRIIALNHYLPHAFILRGRRLLYSQGIYMLVFLTTALLVIFHGVTDHLIPLYAVGAFLAFTLSQAGMVVHWWKHPSPGRVGHMFVNGLGAFATGLTTLVVLVAKFLDGAWLTALLIPLLIAMMVAVRRHYRGVEAEVGECAPISAKSMAAPIVVLTVDRWTRIVEKAVHFGLMLSDDVRAVHVVSQEETAGKDLADEWQKKVEQPLQAAGGIAPEVVIIRSPYRLIIAPIVNYVLEVARDNPERDVAVLVPELVVRHWWENLLHNQRSNMLKLALLLRGNHHILVISIPWYMPRHSHRDLAAGLPADLLPPPEPNPPAS